MKYLKTYNESLDRRTADEKKLLQELESDKNWIKGKVLHSDMAYIYEYKLNDKYKIDIIALNKEGGGGQLSINLYFVDDKSSIIYMDSIFNPYNKIIPQGDSFTEWCIKMGRKQLDYYKEKDRIPTEHELMDAFIELIDIGFEIPDNQILYGYTSMDFPRSSYDNGAYFNKDHKSDQKFKCVINMNQHNNLDVTSEDVEREFNDGVSKLKNLFGYNNIDCKLEITDSRYYNGDHRPESMAIIITNK